MKENKNTKVTAKAKKPIKKTTGTTKVLEISKEVKVEVIVKASIKDRVKQYIKDLFNRLIKLFKDNK